MFKQLTIFITLKRIEVNFLCDYLETIHFGPGQYLLSRGLEQVIPGRIIME